MKTYLEKWCYSLFTLFRLKFTLLSRSCVAFLRITVHVNISTMFQTSVPSRILFPMFSITQKYFLSSAQAGHSNIVCSASSFMDLQCWHFLRAFFMILHRYFPKSRGLSATANFLVSLYFFPTQYLTSTVFSETTECAR